MKNKEYSPELFDKDYYEAGFVRGGFMQDSYNWKRMEQHAKRKLTYMEQQFKRFGMKSILIGCCAKGFEVKEARRRGYVAFGLDISKYAIEHLDPEVAQFCSQGDLRDLSKYADNSFDVVVTFDCIHTIDPADRYKAFDEINRVAKNGVLFRTRILDHHSSVAMADGSLDGTPAVRETFYSLIDEMVKRGKFSMYSVNMEFRYVVQFAFVRREFFTIENERDRDRVVKMAFLQDVKKPTEVGTTSTSIATKTGGVIGRG